MRWYNRLKASAKAAVAGWKGSGFDFSSWFGRRFWGIDNSQIVTNETIFSVISRLANTLSSLPVKLYKDFDVITDHESADVVTNSPNENLSSFDLINKLEVSRNETGNGYAVIGRDIRMRVESITPLDAAYVTPFINADDQNLWYEVRGAEHTYYIHNMNMIHVKHITGTSRLAGISPLNVLKNTLEYDK
ncbi:phage portal protein, partial [Sinorhizobium medicae]|nr:phage portal protein [Sinorhizobium medicae]